MSAEVIDFKHPQMPIVQEMEKSYLDYAMSVIVSRALPDVRDGLKPVHRRILYAQKNLGNAFNTKYLKCARVVGETMGKYHPHGDSAIYDALVRMAQDFSMRLPLEDGQGNFGSMDGDKAAAMRYTEVRMAKASTALMADIDKDTVDFNPNYDGSEQEPDVLPARFPNVLVNGSAGIAVGMATNIPPHNLGEVIDAALHLIDAPETDANELGEFVKGPDFPTGGTIVGTGNIRSALLTGRGSVVVRAKTHEEEIREGRLAIVIDEIPYQLNKTTLIERMAELVRDKVIEGISELRDESDRDGVRMVVELKRDAHPEVVLSQLFKHTSLQTSFSYNMLALDHGRPRLMGVKEILDCFLAHREEVITRRTRFDLNKARDRAHILVGLAIAVANIDAIIKIIRHAPNPQTAKEQLIAEAWSAETVLPLIELLGEVVDSKKAYSLSEKQAQAILDLRLHRLTGLERDKIQDEADEISAYIKELVSILSDRTVLLGVMKDELKEVRETFATPRKTNIIEGSADVSIEDLIQPEECVVTISTDGYVKRQPLEDYRAQRRGGKGRSLTNMKGEGEQIETFFIANTHDPLLFFTSIGKVYKLKVYQIPPGSSGARGKAFVNLLPLEKDEKVNRVVPVPRDTEEWDGQVVLFATANGIIRKTPLKAFANVHVNGIKGMALNEGDQLISVRLAPEESGDVLISSHNGQAVRFANSDLRTIASRTALGVKGITLKDKDQLMCMDVIQEGEAQHILTVTENGFGKRTAVEDFPAKSRGTMGVIAIKTSDRNGKVVASLPVNEGDQIMALTNDGQVIRMNVADISVIGRNTQGVTLFKLDGKKGKVMSVSRISAEVLAEEEPEEGVLDDAEEGAAETAEAPSNTDK